MKILFFTHYFPPEVNAPASRTYEHAKRWVKDGHDVTVITCFPSHPHGKVYEGFKKKLWEWSEVDGINVLRVWTFISPNKGFFKRILNYVSYMKAAGFFAMFLKRPDVVVATSPQFFTALAGWWVSLIKWRPFVFELRDLWPETIITVGAIKSKIVLKVLFGLSSFLYKRASIIISVTESFKDKLVNNKNIDSKKIVVVTNGVDLEIFDSSRVLSFETTDKKWKDKYVVGYIGTIGLCHKLNTVVEAAMLLEKDKDILLFVMGDGAERIRIENEIKNNNIGNLILYPQQPKEEMLRYLKASDAAIVHLQKDDLFKTVIPSKIFEAMAMKKPILMGVEGESRELLLAAECCLPFEPENARELADAIRELKNNKTKADRLGENGYQAVVEKYNRDALAAEMLDALKKATGKE